MRIENCRGFPRNSTETTLATRFILVADSAVGGCCGVVVQSPSSASFHRDGKLWYHYKSVEEIVDKHDLRCKNGCIIDKLHERTAQKKKAPDTRPRPEIQPKAGSSTETTDSWTQQLCTQIKEESRNSDGVPHAAKPYPTGKSQGPSGVQHPTDSTASILCREPHQCHASAGKCCAIATGGTTSGEAEGGGCRWLLAGRSR